jgi:hypothetical protein
LHGQLSRVSLAEEAQIFATSIAKKATSGASSILFDVAAWRSFAVSANLKRA